jgi:hypothetical protein
MKTPITDPQSIRILPEYNDEVVTVDFTTNEDYDLWFATVASKHATFGIKNTRTTSTGITGRPVVSHYFVCDHAGLPRKSETGVPENKRRKTLKTSINVGCLAKFVKHVYANNTVKVVYHWIHNNHDPCQMEDIVSSRLPLELRNWIIDCVDRHMNLKSIKSLLRLNIDQLDEVSTACIA